MLRFVFIYALLVSSASAKSAANDASAPSIISAETESSEGPFYRPQPGSYGRGSSSDLDLLVGGCVGLDTSCTGAGVYADFVGDSGGFRFGVSAIPVGSIPLVSLNSSFRAYGDQDHGDAISPYLHLGVSTTMLLIFTYGGGVGFDIAMGSLLLQPQVGILMVHLPTTQNMTYDSFLLPLPSLSISIVGAP